MSDETTMSDDELLAGLRDVIARADPVPLDVVEAANAVLGWRRLDADLAELLADSALEAETLAGVRGDLRTRSVSFASGDLEVDLEIHREQGRLRLVGQIVPSAVATIEVQAGDGTIVATAEPDALGRFRLELEAVPIARLRLARTDGAQLVETSWLSL